jgi:DNA-binding CsgD family transcriptional regulator
MARRNPGQSAISPSMLVAMDKEEKALALRRAGCSYQQIADQLGCDIAVAHHTVTRAFRDYRTALGEAAEEVRELELQRLDDLYRRENKKSAEGSSMATQMCLKIMERRARMLGIDAPQKHDITVSDAEVNQIISHMHDTLLDVFGDQPEKCNQFIALLKQRSNPQAAGGSTGNDMVFARAEEVEQ